MATLQKIRNRGILLAVVVGVAMLAFIIGDFLNSGSTLFQQSKQTVAEINGEKISIMDFQAKIDQMNKVYQIESGRSNFSEQEMTQMRNSVWENMVTSKLLQAEADKMGLTVSDEELMERLIGNNIHPMIAQRPIFADPNTGQFSQANLLQFYQSIFGDNATTQNNPELQDAKSYWLFWEETVRNSILQEKVMALLSKAVGANNVEAKYNYDARHFTGDVNYIVQPYYELPDSTFKASDNEIKELYEKRKEFYKQEPNRSISFVAFDIVPLEADFKKAEEWINDVSEEFKTTDDVVGLVNAESDISYTGEHYSKQSVPTKLKDFAFSNSTGAIYGPVFENNTYTMAKIMESGIMEADSVRLSMIVLPAESKTTADSIMQALNGGTAFSALAVKYSPNQQTAMNGGDVGWITRSAGVNKEIATPAFSKAVGSNFKISSAQGIQIFKITDKTSARPKVKLAILQREVIPSNESFGIIYNEAKQFAANSTDAKKFETLAQEKGYLIRPGKELTANTDNVNMMPQSRQIVRWAFENKKGKVSDVFDLNRETYVVAMLTDVDNKEYRSMEDVKPQLSAEIIKDKKAEKMIAQMTDLLAKNPTLDGIATALNREIRLAPSVNFSSFQFGDAGQESYVIGRNSVLESGKLSKPLKGQSGVFVIEPLAKTADTTPFNIQYETAQLDARTAQSLPYIIMQKLREKYDVVDNRANFY